MKTILLPKIGFALSFGLLVNTSHGENLRYRQSGDWFAISTGDEVPGWVGATVPGVADNARVNWGGNTITLVGDAPVIQNMQIGVDESGTLEVNDGGVLNAANDVIAGNSNNNVGGGDVAGTLVINEGGVVNVGRILWSARGNTTGNIEINSGGLLEVESHLWLGEIGESTINISGTLQQNGGILGLGTRNAVDPSGGTATINVNDGGLLALNNISGGETSIQPGSLLNVVGTGQVTLPGDFVDVIYSYIENEQIAGNGILGRSALIVDTSTNPGFTTVTAAPVVEPNDSDVVISRITVDEESDEVTFTWNSLENESFIITYSTNLVTFEGELESDYPADAGVETSYTVERLDLPGVDPGVPVFFRVARVQE